jgi:hypothetical protein
MADEAVNDLDETRRLLYLALLVPKTKKYNLAGSLVNALRHHQGVQDPDLETKIADFLEGRSDDEEWLRERISMISAQLGGGA